MFADVDGDGSADALANSDAVGLVWYAIPDDPTRPWSAREIAAARIQEVHGGVSPRPVGDVDGDVDVCLKPWTTGAEHVFLENRLSAPRPGE